MVIFVVHLALYVVRKHAAAVVVWRWWSDRMKPGRRFRYVTTPSCRDERTTWKYVVFDPFWSSSEDVGITGDCSKYDQILFVKVGRYIGFCVYRRSYLLWTSVLVTVNGIDLGH